MKALPVYQTQIGPIRLYWRFDDKKQRGVIKTDHTENVSRDSNRTFFEANDFQSPPDEFELDELNKINNTYI